jgi:rhodanese-related sulfurtransferase
LEYEKTGDDTMAASITVEELRGALDAALTGKAELAILDVREAGQYAAGHLFFATHVPYSRLEIEIVAFVPRKAVPVVVYDAGDGVSEKAAGALAKLGYGDVRCLEGGAPGWAAAGHTLYEGVNLPSKTFGELVELAQDTPHISADDLAAMQDEGGDFVILDGRTPEEYGRFNIPGGLSCPNAELPLRFNDMVPNDRTTVVINCAGRTRSIIGAQTLINFGVPNKVVALENGTQGWALADRELETGARRFPPRGIGSRQGAGRCVGPRPRAVIR